MWFQKIPFYTTCSLKSTEKLAKNSRQKSGVTGTVLIDLNNSYDCLPHDLLIAKLAAYGFGNSATSLISDYLSKRYQRVKIGSVFRSYPLNFERCFARFNFRTDSIQDFYNFRSSLPGVFSRKGVLKICSRFTGEHLCRSGISIKLLGNFAYLNWLNIQL